MIDIAYACALYPLAGYQLTAAALRKALTAAVGDKRERTCEPLAQEKKEGRIDTPAPTFNGVLAEPAVLDRGEARFRLLIAPEGDDGQELTPQDHDVREAVLPCTLADPVSAAHIAALPPGTPLKVTGYLALPNQPGTPLRLVVLTIQAEDTEYDAFAAPTPPRPNLSLVGTAASGPSEH